MLDDFLLLFSGTLAALVKLGVGSSKQIIVKIAKSVNHPLYDRNAIYNDIALHRLERKVIFNEFIRPICLFTQPTVGYKKAIATSWSNEQFMDWYFDGKTFQKVVLDLVADTKLCDKEFINSPFVMATIPFGIHSNSMICTWTPDKETCSAHPGAALQIRINDDQFLCTYYLTIILVDYIILYNWYHVFWRGLYYEETRSVHKSFLLYSLDSKPCLAIIRTARCT